MRTLLALMLFLTTSLAPGWGDEPKSKEARPQPPKDFRIFERDMAGAYFVARPLMDRYDALRRRTASLKAEVAGARIGSAKALAEIMSLRHELDMLLQEINKGKIYIPGASIHKRTETTHLPIKPDDLLLVDCENVEIRGWDGPDVQCVLEKTVLANGGELGAPGRRRRQGRRRLRRDRTRRSQGHGQGVLRVLPRRPRLPEVQEQRGHAARAETLSIP